MLQSALATDFVTFDAQIMLQKAESMSAFYDILFGQ